MTRIIYISRINLLSSRTNVYNLAKTCEALNSQPGFELRLVTTDQERDKKAFFQKMGVKSDFDIVCLGVTNTASKHVGKKWYEFLTFLFANISIGRFILKAQKDVDCVYYRDESLFLCAMFVKIFTNKKVFFEIHSVYEKKYRQIKNNLGAYFSTGIIAISSGVKNYYQRINPNVFVSLCSAAEDSWFDHSKTKSYFREILGLPANSFIVGYAGVVGINPNNDYYEIDDIVRSLKKLPEDVICVLVGELNSNADWLRRVISDSGVADRVKILRWQERITIPKFLQAFDVNLIPKRKKDLVGDSPAKMFPALAAERPIVAGNSESIREVLTNDLDAVIVNENTPDGWAEGILKVKNDSDLRERILKGALITKNKYTWEKRGAAIAEFIKHT